MATTQSHLAVVRKQRGISVAGLARLVAVSRQTIYAIEDGSYVPNTSVALRLSHALGATVEQLFSIEESGEGPGENLLPAEVLLASGETLVAGQSVRLCRVADRLIAVPGAAVTAYLPHADGVVASNTSQTLAVRPAASLANDRFLMAGCDPALSIAAELLKPAGVEIITVPASSQLALEWLHTNRSHAAGSHLLDPETGSYNLPFIRPLFPDGSARVITFASWRQGLLVKTGNPKSISAIASLARKNVRFINREAGSGSRKLLDVSLHSAGIPPHTVKGYGTCAAGHLEIARRIAAGEADAGIATESAARYFGLGFIPLAVERFDLTFTESSLALPAAQALLNTLASAAFRRKLQVIAGYDTSETGLVQL